MWSSAPLRPQLLGELPPDELNTSALIKVLSLALTDKQNDAALSILDSLENRRLP